MTSKEQQAIIDAPIDADLTKAVASPGAGKTFSLLEKAKAHPDLRILYSPFGKAMQMEASKRFPANVACRTTHSLAYARFGGRYRHKLASDIRVTDAGEVLGIEENYALVRDVVSCVKGYCVSEMMDFPKRAIAPDRRITGDDAYLAQVANLARELWSAMCDPGSPVAMMHDGYLKLYQLSKPTLPTDLLLVDEGQDTNAVTKHIYLNQACPKIIVGDIHQSIFAYRGSSDLLNGKFDQEFFLTQSFRFGPRVAEVANAILRCCKGEPRALLGVGFDTQVGDFEGPRVVITRTNAEIFNRAVRALQDNRAVSFIGGASSYGFARLLQAYFLWNGEFSRIQDPFLKQFKSWGQYDLYADEAGDLEAKSLTRLVREHKNRIPAIVTAIQDRELAFGDPAAELTFTNAHRSKGLTVESVELASDFMGLIDDRGCFNGNGSDVQEVNLLFVAATRAVKNLTLNTQLREFLNKIGIRND